MPDSLDEHKKLSTPRLIQAYHGNPGTPCEQNNFREMLAADFHDETGNLLLTIIHQASLLKMRGDKDALPMIESILESSNQLFAISRDLLWNLNDNSDDPHILFEYMAAFGQSFYNQFDISFSAEKEAGSLQQVGKLAPLAALNLVFIFKEAMNNVIKHAGAREVVLKMKPAPYQVIFELTDDGTWKEPDPHQSHYGLKNIERRCTRNGFSHKVRHNNGRGTLVEVSVPITPLLSSI
ncbi:MAG: hypothetical protein INR73_09260 [Williamsia sp.]|nr:hypothetical protein [Williamsia sp.]